MKPVKSKRQRTVQNVFTQNVRIQDAIHDLRLRIIIGNCINRPLPFSFPALVHCTHIPTSIRSRFS